MGARRCDAPIMDVSFLSHNMCCAITCCEGNTADTSMIGSSGSNPRYPTSVAAMAMQRVADEAAPIRREGGMCRGQRCDGSRRGQRCDAVVATAAVDRNGRWHSRQRRQRQPDKKHTIDTVI